MTRMGYDPSAVTSGGGKVPDGEYQFVVREAYELTFKTGNQGVKVVMEMFADDRALTVFDNFAYTPGGLVRLNHFLTCLGLPFDPPPALEELPGKHGTALFKRGEKWLDPEEYIPPNGQAQTFTPPPTSRGAEIDAGDVPF